MAPCKASILTQMQCLQTYLPEAYINAYGGHLGTIIVPANKNGTPVPQIDWRSQYKSAICAVVSNSGLTSSLHACISPQP